MENTDIEFNGTRIFLVDVAVDTGTVPNRLLHRLTVTGGRKHARANPGDPNSHSSMSNCAGRPFPPKNLGCTVARRGTPVPSALFRFRRAQGTLGPPPTNTNCLDFRPADL